VLFGAHVSSSGGIDSALERMQAIGAEALQLFTQSPRTWRPTNHKPEAIERFKARRAELEAPAFAHALYLVNLASPNDDLYEKSVAAMRNTMEVACAIEADGVIFHVGSHQGAGFEAGLERVLPAMKQVLERSSEHTWLLMENSAGAGGTIGRSVEELATLHERLGRHRRLGICLDSCHLFVSGCDVGDREVLDRLLEEIDGAIGLDRLRALHVNDAKAPLGSNRDRHANIGEGLIGEKLGVFLSHPAFQDLPALLETPGADGGGPDAAELRKLRELHARWSG
jgi:deoxyribonuclease-4